ncbi:sigma 54-interacting transcriptional regulator [Pyxidicoccus xibeiensis]|uniref:sigma 54-interacting transcriptional regulator n=1 Tax=Pyxidicoccus xibeiensis TaxID=2906759 RepID=UPI0020A74964|nr:sigma 54-interacting transcriptional regulator [Pyxidicoccus xibeiensis]MCP3138637.1 sigma 54-interacting transcriptional regulator [Pyxidicoccus xibeiensis]
MSSPPPPITDLLTPAPAPAQRLRLVVVAGPSAGLELPLERGTYRVGKEAGNELRLADSAVSRTHLLVEVLAQGVRVTDNDSSNGSFCEGLRFQSLELRPGAVVRIGRSELLLAPASGADAPLAAAAVTRWGFLSGRSLVMRQLFAVLERLARDTSDVLLEGETGTGKELCAESLHQASPRAAAPFVVCDLAGTSPALLEAELFGQLPGALGSGTPERTGACARAQGGTLFLDEVGELPLDVQPRLLRFLERRQFKRLGEDAYRTGEVRVVASSQKDLAVEVAEGRFRQDLYQRLAGVRLRLPPLRERREDISPLIDEALTRLGESPALVSPGTRALLVAHDWPGNVRELLRVVERVVRLGVPAALVPLPSGPEAPAPAPAATLASDAPFKEARERLLQAFERDYVCALLERHGNNVSAAARAAGIDRAYLHRLINRHGLG